MPAKPRLYWDANVFFSYIEATPDHIATLDSLLKSASDGDIQIVTSTLSITEVAYASFEKVGLKLDADVERRLDELWADRSAIRLIEVSQLITREARGLMRSSLENGWTGLKPADAIHLASAKRTGASQFHTYEEGTLDKYDALINCPITRPYTRQPMLPLGDEQNSSN